MRDQRHATTMDAQELEETRQAWDRIAARYDEHVTPTHMWLGKEGLKRVGVNAGMRFLDVAAGSGALSIPAARLGARVTAVDLSPVAIDRLKARALEEGLADVEARVMDGHALELADDTYDVAGSQFGVMLFPDLPRGLAEMVRVTKPGGHVLLNVYGNPQEIEFFAFFVRAMKEAIPTFTPPPLDPPPLPFQVADPQVFRRRLEEAGLRDVRVETITERLRFRSGDEMWAWLVNSNPVAGQILGDTTQAQQDAARRALHERLRERAGEDEFAVLTNPVHIGIGTKPA